MRYTLLIASILLTITSSIWGQNHYRFQHLQEDGGLRNSRCVSVLQDDDGYMWFATHSGIEKFNGSDMQHYSLKAPNSKSGDDNIINVAIKSNYYPLLCGSKSGSLYSYNREMDRFEMLINKDENDLLFNIYTLSDDDKGNVWLGNSNGLFYYNATTDKLSAIQNLDCEVYSLAKYGDNALLVGSNKGLFYLNTDTREINLVALDGIRINTILLRDKNNLLIGTNDSRIASIIVINETVEIRKIINVTTDSNKPIKKIVETPEGQIAVAIDDGGISIYDNALSLISRYQFDKDNYESISSNGVYDLFYAQDNTLWVATWGGGVCFSDPNQKPFKTVQHIPYMDNSLSNNAVSSIAQLGDRIWYATKEGISIHNEKTNTWQHLIGDKHSRDDDYISLSLYPSYTGDVWVATYGKGLMKFSESGELKEVYNKERNDQFASESNHLYCVLEDENKRVWSAGIWGSLSVFDFVNKKKTLVNLTNIRAIFESKDHMFVGTLFGLFIVDKETYEVTRSTHPLINASRIICINQHPDDDIVYLGTDANGLLIWDRENDTLEEMTIEDGMSSNFVRSLLWSSNHNMWIATTGGLNHLNTETGELEKYLREDGLVYSEFSENAAMVHRDGRAFFGSPNGVTIFTPRQITKSRQRTTPILQNIKVLGKELVIAEDGFLNENINLQKTINLPYQKNSLSIAYSAIAYTNPHKVQYKWRLKGLNDMWIGPSSTREANFTQIPPGKYTFEVMASNEDGVWHPNSIKSINLVIGKPYWLSIWAILFYTLLVVGVVYLLLKYTRTMLQEKHSMEKQQFFISIAHDLRTPLSLIKLPVEKMVEKSETLDENRKSLVKVKRNVDRLTNLVNQLLDFQKADLNKMLLRPEKINLALFLEERVQAFEPFSQEKNIMLHTNWDETAHEVYLDKDKMEKIMYNLLSNAFKYTPKGGEVMVELTYSKKNCIITVEDTGEGIPQKQQSNIFKRYYRASNAINSTEVGSGVGLMLTKQLVEFQDGTIRFKSELGKGSTFVVTLPMMSKKLALNTATEEENVIEAPIAPSPATTDEETSKDNKGEKVLVVEDNPELRQTLVEELSEKYTVIEAADGVEGVRLAKQQLPRIIISDVMMPHKSGHELCAELKEALETCHIPIILLTALDSPEYKREGLEYGADAYMEKPFEIKLLLTQISNLVKNREIIKKKFLIPTHKKEEVDSRESLPDPNEVLLQKVRDYVLDNILDSKLSVETAAIEVGLSRPVLYRKIKSLTDLSPQQFILTIRLNEAARLIKTTAMNISEAAYDTGFSDPKYFSQIFKKHFGMTPSQYIKSDD